MSLYSSRHVVKILRDTIRSVERGANVHPSDPAFLELKRVLQLQIARLEAESSQPEIVVQFPGGGAA